jgi:putative resolvase
MEKLYTLKEAKKLLGVTAKSIQRWDKEGKIRVVRTVGGRRIPESEIKRILELKEERVVAGYARVSSTTQKDDLERQKQLLHSYAKGLWRGSNTTRRGFRPRREQEWFSQALRDGC